ncbi:MAG: glucose-6-phosphate isomerase [Halanaerobiales bacterium]
MFTEMVGKQGIKREEVDKYQKRTEAIHKELQQAKEEGKVGFMELPYTPEEEIERIKKVAAGRKGEIDNFVILGIGGSALGSIALRTALKDPYHNLKGEGIRLFVPDNVDPVRFKDLLSELDLNRTIFNVISKSGGTAETMSQFLIARQAVAREVGEGNLARHFIATTSRDSGYLIEIAEREGFTTFYIPENVGGRFSVLTPVGLVFAAFADIDIESLLAGAREMDRRCSTDNIRENPAYLNGILQYLAYQQGKRISVMMPYAHSLRDVADWYRQLWAESLGKELNRSGEVVNVGPTPVKALGATDQHSQAQLYMEGPYDKVITFLEVEEYGTEVKIPTAYEDIEGVSYLGGHTLNELIKTEKKATELALTRRNRPNTTIILPRVNEFTIGQLFYMLELQTAFVGELFDVNAFNQPGVELGKHYIYGVLGRDGYDEKKDEYLNRPHKNEDYII